MFGKQNDRRFPPSFPFQGHVLEHPHPDLSSSSLAPSSTFKFGTGFEQQQQYQRYPVPQHFFAAPKQDDAQRLAVLDSLFGKESEPSSLNDPCEINATVNDDLDNFLFGTGRVSPSLNNFCRGNASSKSNNMDPPSLRNLSGTNDSFNDMAGIEASLFNAMETTLNDDLPANLNDMDSFPSSSNKKASHNLRERYRRNKLKVLYSGLRQLLPNPNPKKRLSIPNTVCRVLKYIPELRNEIERLTKCRDKLARKAVARWAAASEVSETKNNNNNNNTSIYPLVAVCPAFSCSELVVTVCADRGQDLHFSELLSELEASTLDLVNASSFTSDNRICYSIHVKTTITKMEVDTNILHRRLLSVAQRSLRGGIKNTDHS